MNNLISLEGLEKDSVLCFGIDRKSCSTVEKFSETLQNTIYTSDGSGVQRQIVCGMESQGVKVLNNNNVVSSLLHELDSYVLTPEEKWKKGKLSVRLILEFVPEDNS